jgi:hypothetical protein
VATRQSDPTHDYTAAIMLFVGWAVIVIVAVLFYCVRDRLQQCSACAPAHVFMADVSSLSHGSSNVECALSLCLALRLARVSGYR